MQRSYDSEKQYLILTSVMGLGTYIPALFLRDALVSKKIKCNVDVIEKYFSEEQIKHFEDNKIKFHENIKYAKIAHRIAASRFDNLLQQEQMDWLLSKWLEKKIDTIVLMSGNWLPMAEYYFEHKKDCTIYTIHMDVGITPSWNKHINSKCPIKQLHVYDTKGVNFLFASPQFFFPFETTQKKIFIHGGGWGMGTYKNAFNKLLKECQYLVLTTIYDENEISVQKQCDIYLLSNKWKPWQDDQFELQYPPFEKITSTGRISLNNAGHRALYKLYYECGAIITKPGGGSLMDSLITGIPLVLLDPIAKHEEENLKLWINLGLGITFQQWEKENYSWEILEDLNKRIREYIRINSPKELYKVILE